MSKIDEWVRGTLAWHNSICSCSDPGKHLQVCHSTQEAPGGRDGDGVHGKEETASGGADSVEALLLAAEEIESGQRAVEKKPDTSGTLHR